MITRSHQFAQTSPTLSLLIGFSLKIDKKHPQRPSEILPTPLGCHQKLLLDDRGWRRTLGQEAELEMADYLIDGHGVFDEGNDLHPTSTARTKQRIYLVDFTDHLGPPLGGHIVWLIFNDGGMIRRSLGSDSRSRSLRFTSPSMVRLRVLLSRLRESASCPVVACPSSSTSRRAWHWAKVTPLQQNFCCESINLSSCLSAFLNSRIFVFSIWLPLQQIKFIHFILQ